jgi:nucleoside-diphosphate-sugar epimerase
MSLASIARKDDLTKILIVGASGFVGSHLAHELRCRGIPYKVSLRGFERRTPIYDQYFITGSLKNNFDWQPHLENIEVIIFSAGRAHIQKETSEDPFSEYWAINVDAAVNCAQQAAKSGVKRFIYLSTIKVNGENTFNNEPFSNNSLPCPQDAYAQTKLEAEIRLQVIAESTGMELVIIRPPLIYGPGVRANFRMMMKIISLGLPLPFSAIVDNKRSLVSVYNLIDLIICCIDHPSAANELFLVSDGSDTSTADLLSMLSKQMGVKSRIFKFPIVWLALILKYCGKGTLIDRLLGSLQIDLSYTSKKLNWKPPLSLKDGLRLTVCDYLSKRNDKTIL